MSQEVYAVTCSSGHDNDVSLAQARESGHIRCRECGEIVKVDPDELELGAQGQAAERLGRERADFNR